MKELIDNTRLINSKCQPPNVQIILTKVAFIDKTFKGSKVKSSNVPIKDVAVVNFFKLETGFAFIMQELIIQPRG